MSLEQNKAIVLRFYKAFDQGDLEQAKEIVSPNIVTHGVGPATLGGDSFFEHVQMMRSTFPDGYHTIEDVIAEDDRVVTRGTFTGTHQRELLGIPPTGKQVIFSVVQIDRLVDGKIVEHWAQGDTLAIMQQLGKENLV